VTVREFGRAYSYRPQHKIDVEVRAQHDVTRMVREMREACVDLNVSAVEIVDGPRLDWLGRYETLGWRIEAESPTFEFARRYLQNPASQETLWQHAKRSLKAWWDRQRGRAL
jgi:hypothetical protein